MESAKREYSKRKIDKAGQALITGDYIDFPNGSSEVLTIVNNWRVCHNHPLNTFKVTLHTRSKSIDKDALIAQRIKRLSSIELKLRRYPKMNLSQMQDLGGCRAVLGTIMQVRKLVNDYKQRPIPHELNRIDDYIENPKDSGYRGIHLIYKAKYKAASSQIYNNQYIEIQLRSKLQHLWATAVETAGTFLRQSLKSSQGEEDWLRFFQLAGSAFALREKAPLVPETPKEKKELLLELKKYSDKLNVQKTLSMFGHAIQISNDEIYRKKNYKYFLLVLKPKENRMNVSGFSKNDIAKAAAKYVEIESQISSGNIDGNAVLVSVDSFANYFLDTTLFLKELKELLQTL
jgi:Region found in RelA / SpoT proteins